MTKKAMTRGDDGLHASFEPEAGDGGEKPAAAKDPLFVTALARGLEILRCFTAERKDLGTSEIARLTGLPQPTVWRLCKTLSQLGYLVPGSSPDRLRVGAAVLMLGHTAITHTGIASAALPLMREVADRFGISVSLAERHGTDMVVVQRIEAPSILHLKMHVGSAMELGDSSLGWAWLAAQPVEERAPILKELRKRYAAQWPAISGKLDEAFEEYATHGFVLNFAKSHPDVNAIGVAVISPHGARTMALTCGGAKSSLSSARLMDEVAPAMLELARKIAPLLVLETQS